MERVADARKSFVCDFYQDREIPEAIAFKIYEALKTAILLNTDEHAPHGFDEAKASQFLDNIAKTPYRTGRMLNDNTLAQPLDSLRLSDAQRNFLIDRSEARNTIVHKAIECTLATLREHAEIKVPRFISLDGAALPAFVRGRPEGPFCQVTQFKSESSESPPLAFDDSAIPVRRDTTIVEPNPRCSQRPQGFTCPG